MSKRTWTLDERAIGRRADQYLAELLGVSRGRIRELLERGDLSLDGRRLQRKGVLLPGRGELALSGVLAARDECAQPSYRPDVRVIEEGEDWVAIDKPAATPVHPLSIEQTDTALNAIVERFPQIQGVGEAGLRSGVVHRLDVDTSGVLLFALSEKRWQELRDAFSDHVVQKRYLALVHGVVQAPGDVELELVVARRSPSFVRVARDSDRDRAGCRNCRTVYRPVAQLVDSSLVELMPESGYLHQIRVTMAHIGHPLVGDHRYGHEDGVDRHMLHAAELKVGEISVAAPLALDFEKELRLRGWD